MYVLGAGASKEAGVPTTVEMTDCIVDSLSGVAKEVVLFVLGGLLFQRGVAAADPRTGVDVEELFAAVELLARRHTLEAAPFIGAWHARVDELDRVTTSGRYQIQDVTRKIYETIIKELERTIPATNSSTVRAIDGAVAKFAEKGSRVVGRAVMDALSDFTRDWLKRAKQKRPHGEFGLDRAFAAAVASSQAQPGVGTIFGSTAAAMISQLKSMVWINDAGRTEYLQPLLSEVSGTGRLCIATLNYDNCIELASAAQNVPCDTGIAEWSASGVFRMAPEDLSLLKLHGSIDWVAATEPSDSRLMPQPMVRTASAEELESGAYEPAVVFGLGNKLQAEGPYLDLLQQFRRELASADELIVVGYSFRDPHVNHYISAWLNDDQRRVIKVVDPGFPASKVFYAQELRSSLHGSGRLEVFAEPAGTALRALTS